MKRIDIWHYQFRITQPGVERATLADDHIMVPRNIDEPNVVEMAKATLDLPKDAEVSVRFCYRHWSATLPAGHVLIQVAESNEELAP